MLVVSTLFKSMPPRHLLVLSLIYAGLQEKRAVLTWEHNFKQNFSSPPHSWTKEEFYLSSFFFFFFVGLFELRDICTCKAGALLFKPHFQFILLWLFSRWGFVNYLPKSPLTMIFPISASQVAKITGVSHQACGQKYSYILLSDYTICLSFMEEINLSANYSLLRMMEII
jgi:hypothetical protein